MFVALQRAGGSGGPMGRMEKAQGMPGPRLLLARQVSEPNSSSEEGR